MSQWAHGQFVQYVTYKARALGINTGYIPEGYSTRTCSVCGHLCSSSPRGRMFQCPGCGAVLSRDGNGGANICSRARYGSYSKVQLEHLTYLRPLVVVEPRRGPKLLAQSPVPEPKGLALGERQASSGGSHCADGATQSEAPS
jgi:predicted RNA-binding Zn-ribbon protein involved in translation (DUF1610 family)